jgi:hypothetical protein
MSMAAGSPTAIFDKSEKTNPSEVRFVKTRFIRVDPWPFLESQIFEKVYFNRNQQLTLKILEVANARPAHSTQEGKCTTPKIPHP